MLSIVVLLRTLGTKYKAQEGRKIDILQGYDCKAYIARDYNQIPFNAYILQLNLKHIDFIYK
jgi:hypothetical protein